MTSDHRFTEPNFVTSQNSDTEQGTTAPHIKTTEESERIQPRKRAEKRDESNVSDGKANSPASLGHYARKKKGDRAFTRNSVNKHVEDIIMTLKFK